MEASVWILGAVGDSGGGSLGVWHMPSCPWVSRNSLPSHQ